MKQFLAGTLAVSVLAACGGSGGTNPFTTTTTTGGSGTTTTTTIPTALIGDLGEFTYDPVAQTLTVTGISLEAEPIEGTYTRNAALDRGNYEAYTTQESPLDRHSTAYVREIDGTRAVVVMTGNQFGRYFPGVSYGRDGAFDPPASTPTTGLASYVGDYVGLTDIPSDGSDLLPVDPAVPIDLRTTQAGSITGRVLINADFADNQVNGGIADRVLVSTGQPIESVDLAVTEILADGTFTGTAEQALQNRGTYGGIFGGDDARIVAGGVSLADHISTVSDEEEYGIFVLIQCGTAGADPLCD